MRPLQFEWHKEKARSNLSKHQVSFEEASTVFDDQFARTLYDEDHSIDEEREIIVGHSILNRLLVVSFTEKLDGVVRIVSARLATKKERKRYEEKTNI